MPEWAAELAVARMAARQAGAVAARMQGNLTRSDKSDGSPVTDGDLAADAAVRSAIATAFPDDAILSEEVVDDPARLSAHRLWIIDPIDGTRAYVEGREEWCVQVALVVDGAAVLGVLDIPSRGIQLWGAPGRSGNNETPLGLPTTGARDVLAASSSERNRKHLDRVRACLPEFAYLPANSVGFKAAQILLGEADLFVHPRNIAEWDACAPAIVLTCAGAQATDLAGHALRYNTPACRCPGLVFSRRPDHTGIVARLAAAGIVLP